MSQQEKMKPTAVSPWKFTEVQMLMAKLLLEFVELYFFLETKKKKENDWAPSSSHPQLTDYFRRWWGMAALNTCQAEMILTRLWVLWP